MSPEIVFSCLDGIDLNQFILSTYCLEMDATSDVITIARDIAVGQTTGTWIPVPQETEEIRKKHVGRVVGIYEVPHYERTIPSDIHKRHFILQIAIPLINIDFQIPMLLSTIAGNDITITYQVKLLDVRLPEKFVNAFKGPNFGISGIRKLLNIKERPVVLNMIKPCIGIDPKIGAELFYNAAIGGVDVVKDDEILGNPSSSPTLDRVGAYMQKERQAFEETGEHTLYAVNITSEVDQLKDHAYSIIEAGANCLMLNYLPNGLSALRMLAEDDAINVPILVHLDLSCSFFGSSNSGIGAALILGKFPRLAGGDMVVYPSPYGKFLFLRESYFRVAHMLRANFYHIKPVFPAPSGGVHAGNLSPVLDDIGNDCIIGVGGAIHGHKLGAVAGAKSVRQAIDAWMTGIPLNEAAKENKELALAIEAWGVHQ